MSRVKAVVGTSIKVDLTDLVPGDVLHLHGGERDPIIKEILTKGPFTKLIYHPRPPNYVFPEIPVINESIWLDVGDVFIHDLKRERFEFLEENDNGQN